MQRNQDVPSVSQLPSREQIGSKLTAGLAKILGCSPAEIDTDKPFDAFGLSSLDGLLLLGDLEEWLDVDIPPTAIADHPTLDRFSGYLLTLVSSPAPTTR